MPVSPKRAAKLEQQFPGIKVIGSDGNYHPDLKRAVVARFRASGDSPYAFARWAGLSPITMKDWLRAFPASMVDEQHQDPPAAPAPPANPLSPRVRQLELLLEAAEGRVKRLQDQLENTEVEYQEQFSETESRLAEAKKENAILATASMELANKLEDAKADAVKAWGEAQGAANQEGGLRQQIEAQATDRLALQEIGVLCGRHEWDHPGQVVRDVRDLLERNRELHDNAFSKPLPSPKTFTCDDCGGGALDFQQDGETRRCMLCVTDRSTALEKALRQDLHAALASAGAPNAIEPTTPPTVEQVCEAFSALNKAREKRDKETATAEGFKARLDDALKSAGLVTMERQTRSWITRAANREAVYQKALTAARALGLEV